MSYGAIRYLFAQPNGQEFDNEALGRFVAMAFAEGDLGPLIHRVKMRKTLTEAEYEALQAVLEAAAAKKKWRPPHRQEAPEWVKRTEAYKMLFNYLILTNIYGVVHKKAIYQLELHCGLKERQIQNILAWARTDRPILDDPAIMEVTDPPPESRRAKPGPGEFYNLVGLPKARRKPKLRRKPAAIW